MPQSLENLWDGIKILARVDSGLEKMGLCHAAFLNRADLEPAARRLVEHGYFLEDITAMDWKEGFELLYHFDLLEKPARIVLRVLLDHQSPEVPSISALCPGAQWHERECFDFYGIRFSGHPQLIPILLPDDLGMHPLVKLQDKRMSLYDCLEGYGPLPVVKGELYDFPSLSSQVETKDA